MSTGIKGELRLVILKIGLAMTEADTRRLPLRPVTKVDVDTRLTDSEAEVYFECGTLTGIAYRAHYVSAKNASFNGPELQYVNTRSSWT